MPTYGYRCTVCKHEFELFQKLSDDPIKICEKCQSPVKKILYPVGIAFKGEGFHVNDYKKDSAKAPVATEPTVETKSETPSAETTSTETKSTETKTEAKATPPPPSPSSK